MLSSAYLVTAIARSYIGANPNGNKSERALFNDIINTFNTVKPYGLTMKKSYPWCAASWTAWQIMAGNKHSEIPMSASCAYLISEAKKLGIWKEDESVKPQIGWGILYDWQDGANYKTTDNKGDADHVGIIYAVDSKNIYIIEGNKGTNHICGTRAVAINGRYIRGFIAPKYSALEKSKYVPSAPYKGSIPKTVVHYGSEGADAKALQEFLNWCIDAKLTVDGQFGRASTTALLVYQATYGLVTDGFFGEISRAKADHIAQSYAVQETPKASYKGVYPSLDKSVINVQKELARVANELAYTTNTKEANYPSGHPKAAYKTALAKLPYDGHKWNAWAKVGASCDVGVWTIIRTAFSNLGITNDIPPRAGLWVLIKWLDKTGHFKRINVSEAEAGDPGAYKKNKVGRHGHIFMCYATLKTLASNVKGKVKEASARSYYLKTTNSLRDRLSTKGKKWVRVWRAVNIVTTKALKRGSKGENVKNLQRFLNWYFKPKYGKDVLKVDGEFGAVTENYFKLFQSEQNLTVDGKCGSKSIAQMKKVVA